MRWISPPGGRCGTGAVSGGGVFDVEACGEKRSSPCVGLGTGVRRAGAFRGVATCMKGEESTEGGVRCARCGEGVVGPDGRGVAERGSGVLRADVSVLTNLGRVRTYSAVWFARGVLGGDISLATAMRKVHSEEEGRPTPHGLTLVSGRRSGWEHSVIVTFGDVVS